VAEYAGKTGVSIPRRARRSDGDSEIVFWVGFGCLIGYLGVIGGGIPCAKH